MKTIKREAKVGERIIITEVDPYEHMYYNGDIFEVAEVEFTRVYTCEEHYLIYHSEYEVIIENETEEDVMINEIEARFENAVEQAREAIEQLRLAAMAKGYEDARKDLTAAKPKTLEVGDLVRALAKCVKENRDRLTEEANAYEPIVSPQQQRDAIVEQAKKDVADLTERMENGVNETVGNNTFRCFVTIPEFVVNGEKRAVVVLVRSSITLRVAEKGIAKCAPIDCFNAHIGKAIALRRALGLEVPAEYLSAPQPTEVRVGDVVRGEYDGGMWHRASKQNVKYYEVKIEEITESEYRYTDGGYDYKNDATLLIIDDTREGVDG